MSDKTEWRPERDLSWSESLREAAGDMTGVIVGGMHEARSHRATLRARWQGRHPMRHKHVRQVTMPTRLAVMASAAVVTVFTALAAMPDSASPPAAAAPAPARTASAPADGPGEPQTSPAGAGTPDEPSTAPEQPRATQTRSEPRGMPSHAPRAPSASASPTERPSTAPSIAGSSPAPSDDPSGSPSPSASDPTPSDDPSATPSETPSEEAPSDGGGNGNDGEGVPQVGPEPGPTVGEAGSPSAGDLCDGGAIGCDP